MRVTLLLLMFVSVVAAQGPPSPPSSDDSASFLRAQFAPLPPLPAGEVRRIDDLLRQMTLAEKVGQMTQLEIGMVTDGQDQALHLNPDKLRTAVVEYGV